MIPYGIAHCHACFDLYGNGFLLTRQWSLLSILLTLDCGLNFNVYKMASKLHCLTNQDKPDNGQWHTRAAQNLVFSEKLCSLGETVFGLGHK